MYASAIAAKAVELRFKKPRFLGLKNLFETPKKPNLGF